MRPKPKKRLGQNFLVDKNIQKKIIQACQLKPADIVLEIGAGRGELSRLIAKKVYRLYAVEIDTNLSQILKEDLKVYKNVRLINQDILKLNLNRCIVTNKLKVIGNIPYYITTPIIAHLVKYKNKIAEIFLTVQKEFAKRMVAQPGRKDYGAFSCFVQYYTDPKILFYIKKGCFYPQPKVDSCFLRLELRDKPAVEVKNERLFFKIIRQGFQQRRKTLRNSLKGIVSQGLLLKFFAKYGIDCNIRPERLSLQEVANLVNLK
ncbi:MAG: ribosomal RNA small subunit methyltransferase A [Candidatus Omnitrophica bacterium]|nr:ribosomal RNA small subunit methyltransferase A [Candidatus Omnitrophota bacterium]